MQTVTKEDTMGKIVLACMLNGEEWEFQDFATHVRGAGKGFSSGAFTSLMSSMLRGPLGVLIIKNDKQMPFKYSFRREALEMTLEDLEKLRVPKKDYTFKDAVEQYGDLLKPFLADWEQKEKDKEDLLQKISFYTGQESYPPSVAGAEFRSLRSGSDHLLCAGGIRLLGDFLQVSV